MTEIKNSLLPDLTQSVELEYFLSSYFNQTTLIHEYKQTYGDYLVIEYSKQNKIKSIKADETKLCIKKLIADVKEALGTTGEIQVDSKFLFSPVIVEKCFRYRDEFQILPAPSNAPKIDRMYIAASHPLTLEYSFPKSSNPFINGFRSDKKYNELALLLNSLLRHGTELIPNSQSKKWVRISSPNEIDCKYLWIGYQPSEIDNRKKDALGFTSVEEYESFVNLEYNKYYSTYGYSSDDYNQFLPSNFASTIEHYFTLNQGQREKFLNSSYWVQVASEIFSSSMSTAFSALVTSIEVFLPSPKDRCKECNKPVSDEICSTCKQPSAGPTKYFREFIEAYSPGIEEKYRKELYDLRSSILHGGKLMSADKKYLGYQYNTESTNGIRKWHLLNSIIRMIQNNWINSQQNLGE